MDISVKEIQAILAIQEEGNLTRAAQRLYISQPALSMTLKKIEQELGAKLFSRQNNRLVATYAGKRFIEAGKNILKICRDVENEIEDQRQGGVGKNKVVIGMPFNLISYIFPRLFTICREKYPWMQLIPMEGSTGELEAMLLSGELDLALVPAFIERQESFHIIELFSEKLVLSVPKDHPINYSAYTKPGINRPFIDFRQLDRQPFITSAPGQHVRQASDMAFKKAGITPKNIFVTKNVQTKITVAGAGLGCALFPEHYLKFSTMQGGANYYYIEDIYDPGWKVCIIYKKGTYFSDGCKQCTEILTDIFRE
jgi:DNA-binding transcriptional LysR family regulator